MKKLKVWLTTAERDHLLTLLRDTEAEGGYYGNEEQYWNRHKRIGQELTGRASGVTSKNQEDSK